MDYTLARQNLMQLRETSTLKLLITMVLTLSHGRSHITDNALNIYLTLAHTTTILKF